MAIDKGKPGMLRIGSSRQAGRWCCRVVYGALVGMGFRWCAGWAGEGQGGVAVRVVAYCVQGCSISCSGL